MIPIVLITGFLGSGKTTLLKNIMRSNTHLKVVYLVNEFSALDVDGQLAASVNDDVVAIPGGSIFCKCLVTTFMYHLNRLPADYGTPDSPVQAVVVEASGISDPAVMQTMLKETKLDSIYNLGSVIAVVDPNTYPKLVHTLPNIINQVKSADTIIMNKADMYTPEQIDTAVQLVRESNETANLVITQMAEVDVDIMRTANERQIHGDYAKCADPNFCSFAFTPATTLLYETIQKAASELGDALYRLKGVISCDGQLLYIDYSTHGWSEPVAVQGISPSLVIIGRGKDRQRIQSRIAMHQMRERQTKS